MAHWQKKDPDFRSMDRLIRARPGIRPAELARALGVARSTILRRLPSLEKPGISTARTTGAGCGRLFRPDARLLRNSGVTAAIISSTDNERAP